MRNRFLYKIYIITILSLFLYSQNNHQIYNLETNIIEEKTDLQKWLELFAKESGADAIAISVGNQHLQTKKIAKIDISKIRAIENVTSSPLVLHGGSGIPANIRKNLARNHNNAKFNIGTELRMLFGNTIRKNILINKRSYDRIELLKPTIKETKKLTKKIISNIGPLV